MEEILFGWKEVEAHAEIGSHDHASRLLVLTQKNIEVFKQLMVSSGIWFAQQIIVNTTVNGIPGEGHGSV